MTEISIDVKDMMAHYHMTCVIVLIRIESIVDVRVSVNSAKFVKKIIYINNNEGNCGGGCKLYVV